MDVQPLREQLWLCGRRRAFTLFKPYTHSKECLSDLSRGERREYLLGFVREQQSSSIIYLDIVVMATIYIVQCRSLRTQPALFEQRFITIHIYLVFLLKHNQRKKDNFQNKMALHRVFDEFHSL